MSDFKGYEFGAMVRIRGPVGIALSADSSTALRAPPIGIDCHTRSSRAGCGDSRENNISPGASALFPSIQSSVSISVRGYPSTCSPGSACSFPRPRSSTRFSTRKSFRTIAWFRRGRRSGAWRRDRLGYDLLEGGADPSTSSVFWEWIRPSLQPGGSASRPRRGARDRLRRRRTAFSAGLGRL